MQGAQTRRNGGVLTGTLQRLSMQCNAADGLFTKSSRLLTDAEPAEDLIEYLFGGGVAGNFTQAVQGGLKICGGKFRRDPFLQPFPGTLYRFQGLFQRPFVP